jgi:hypothetical protein
MLEEAHSVLAANRIERTSDGFNQCLVRASLGFAYDVLELGERSPSMGEKSGE